MTREPQYECGTILSSDDSDTQHRIQQRLVDADSSEVWYNTIINDEDIRLVPETHYDTWTED